MAKIVSGEVIREPLEDPYILTDRTVVRHVGRADLGYWLTKLEDEYRLYAPDIFEEHFRAPIISPNKRTYDLVFEFTEGAELSALVAANVLE